MAQGRCWCSSSPACLKAALERVEAKRGHSNEFDDVAWKEIKRGIHSAVDAYFALKLPGGEAHSAFRDGEKTGVTCGQQRKSGRAFNEKVSGAFFAKPSDVCQRSNMFDA